MEHRIQTPLTRERCASLHAGDTVLLSGTVYTARDAAHARLCALLDENKPLPVDLDGAVIYYAGPTPSRPGEIIGSAGPTTSYRMDAYAPRLLRLGLLGMIGKGARGDEVVQAMRACGAVYFAAIGGAGALMASCITAAEIVCYEDLGSEAIRRLTVRDMPLTVVVDSSGADLYRLGPAAYLAAQGRAEKPENL
ncbi:MAG: Fe-S-containing hydro-lyase [Ruthenibacterium sp.]